MDLSWVFAVLISSVNDPLNSFSSPSSGSCSLNNPKSHKKVILKCLEGFTWCYVRGRSIINCKHPVKIRSTIKESNNRLALPVWSDAYKDDKNVSLLGIHEFSVYLKFFLLNIQLQVLTEKSLGENISVRFNTWKTDSRPLQKLVRNIRISKCTGI